MADTPKQEEMGFRHQDQQQDRRRVPESRAQRLDGSVLLDMERLSLLVDGGVDGHASVEPGATVNPRVPKKTFLQKTLFRKFSQRGDRKAAADGDPLLTTTATAGDGGGRGGAAPTAAAASAPATATSDKFVTVALAHAAAPEATASTPPPQAAPCRRAHGRRAAAASSPWLDPRRVLLLFATLSSMGTIILLYFTLSMGKMGDGDADAR